MLKLLLHTVLFLLPALVVSAQQPDKLGISVIADQNVYVSGEEIWLEGRLDAPSPSLKYVQVQLLDRKGISRASLRLLNLQGRFSGMLELPAELASDYYFLDAFAEGIPSSVNRQPVLVINPKLPPATCSVPVALNRETVSTPSQKLEISTSKDQYNSREEVIVTSSLPAGVEYALVVKRSDLLSDMVDSMSAGVKLHALHEARGERETEGNLIRARISSTMESTPQRGVRLYVAVMGDQAKISSGVSDADGIVSLVLPFIYGETQLVFSLEGNNDQRYRIEMLEDSVPPVPIVFPCLQLNESMRAAMEERILAFRAQKGYFGGTGKQFHVQDSDTTDFYGRPDHFYALDNYVRFPDMKEVLVEFVPEARVRESNSGAPVLQVLDEPYKTFFEPNALVLLDGIPVQDIKALLAFDPLLIRSVDIMSRKYYLGDQLFHGIIHYKTYTANLSGFTLPDRDVIYPYNGIQIPADPTFRTYEKNPADPLPDFRNLLYKASVEKSLQDRKNETRFFTSDADGRYKIVVRGQDAGGATYYGEKIISVQ